MEITGKSVIPACALATFLLAGISHANADGIRCEARENGSSATGTMEIWRQHKRVGRVTCGDTLEVAPGKYEVTIQIDGVLDRPTKTRQVSVSADRVSKISVDFPTGILEVRIEAQGRRGVGTVVVSRGKKQLGSLSSGVAGHLSAGNYRIEINHKGLRQTHRVTVNPGQRRVFQAKF